MKNVGNADRTIRVIIGIVLLSLLFIVKSNAKYWGLIGLVPLITGLIGYCPLYTIFGINTLKKKR
ncbi:YgaP family membrane protein [Caldicellulosiruptor morganii]|uniref:DUF2892 domain-containing protein n=1 Tax=Caldicellulosiruptor morganii TaxID=1387555 RepID=A0ABY7BM33_9FIRM|nr:DUF2892 domain-containing protein [Caldicellulosiruptor morganii]WAM33874.1 DUF2892 domain-containing protein [Caldicellulosiruptor morganii]